MKNHAHSLELLESRIAPSTLHLVNPTTATYTDADGDAATVKFTKGILSAADLTNVLVTVPAGLGDQLQTIDLTAAGLAAPAGGTGITVTAVLAAGGDGLVNVGFVKATGLDLGAINIHGDLGALNAGDAISSTPGVKSLTLQSFGVMGKTTGATSLESDIQGPLGSLKVAGDMTDAYLVVLGPGSDFAAGKIGSISIGGSLIGGTGDESGGIQAANSIGPIHIGQDVIGGTGVQTGAIVSDGGTVASITIGGSLIGSPIAGTNANSGKIIIHGDLSLLKIGRDLQGGARDSSASVNVDGKLGGVSIGGSIIGGVGNGSGKITSGHAMGAVTIGGDLRGAVGGNSGSIEAGGKLAGVTIAGSLVGAGPASGQIFVDHHFDLGPVVIRGNMQGGGGGSSGSIGLGGTLASITVGGSVTAGGALFSGEIASGGAINLVKIGGDLNGTIAVDNGLGGGALGTVSIGGSLNFGVIESKGAAGAITIGLDMVGGLIKTNSFASLSVGGSLLNVADVTSILGDLGAVKIGRDVGSSARIETLGKLKSLTVGGSVAGQVSADGALGPVKIAGDINGGSVHSNGKIDSVAVGGSLIGGGINGSIGAVSIGGDVRGGIDSFGQGTGSIQSNGPTTTLTIGGSLIGGSYAGTSTLFTSGEIFLTTVKVVSIGGDLVGGDVSGSGSIDGSGDIQATHVDKLLIGGSIKSGVDGSSGTLTHDGSINVGHDIGSLTINGSLLGRPDTGNGASPVVISAEGQAIQGRTVDLAIGSLTVLGQVQNADILAGYSRFLVPMNGDAQIGAVKVGGNWTASNLVAGAMNSASSNTSFGDANDASIGAGSATIVASIASIVIGGQVFGTAGPTDHFGFVSEFVGSFSAAGTVFPLTPGAHNDNRPLGATNDVSVHEI